jgi:DNA uptake protein ComE-like DNA-binding protein
MRTPSPWAILLLAFSLLPTALAQSTPFDPIDINHATVSQLLHVPGMTPAWAGRIVRFRPYRAKSDLVEKGVLPSDVYARIRNNIIAHKTE